MVEKFDEKLWRQDKVRIVNGLIGKVLLTIPLLGLNPSLSAAQDTLPWRLFDYPTGGAGFSKAVANPLTSKPDLLVPTCRALAPGNAQQTASGFAGIGIAVELASEAVSEGIVDRLPECCQIVISSDSDANIAFGAALALATRDLGEKDIEPAREIERMIGLCGDEVALRSYEIARGEDSLGRLIAQEDANSPVSTGSVLPPTTNGGGGVPSPS